MVIIVLVSPINSFSGIITAVEPNVALLASVFMADNYYKEYRSRAGMAGIMLRKRSAINIIKHPVSNILGKSKIITLFQISQKSTRKP